MCTWHLGTHIQNLETRIRLKNNPMGKGEWDVHRIVIGTGRGKADGKGFWFLQEIV